MTRHSIPSRFAGSALVFVTLLFVPVLAAAQTPRQAGPVLIVAGGVNVARLSLPFPDLDFEELEVTVDNGSRAGFAGGLFVDVGVTPRAAFTTGALYSERGGKATAEVFGFGAATVDFRMTYLDVPLLARLELANAGNRKFSVLAGGLAGLRLHARAKISSLGQSASESFTDALPVFDFGVTIGGRADFGRGSVTVYYTHGLVDLTEGLSPEAVKHRVFTALAGWRF